ncbi:unnamed protein product [Durusdinium trenchii]|uniref:Uncharacterized protein n=1 Tax=Durusdinium trenchii TaxID=1381693 RepID=A0ABP0RRZ3_9DINO
MLRSKDQENEFHSLPLLTHISNLHEVAIRENPLPQDPDGWTRKRIATRAFRKITGDSRRRFQA